MRLAVLLVVVATISGCATPLDVPPGWLDEVLAGEPLVLPCAHMGICTIEAQGDTLRFATRYPVTLLAGLGSVFAALIIAGAVLFRRATTWAPRVASVLMILPSIFFLVAMTRSGHVALDLERDLVIEQTSFVFGLYQTRAERSLREFRGLGARKTCNTSSEGFMECELVLELDGEPPVHLFAIDVGVVEGSNSAGNREALERIRAELGARYGL